MGKTIICKGDLPENADEVAFLGGIDMGLGYVESGRKED
jgi:hypothetical protein